MCFPSDLGWDFRPSCSYNSLLDHKSITYTRQEEPKKPQTNRIYTICCKSPKRNRRQGVTGWFLFIEWDAQKMSDHRGKFQDALEISHWAGEHRLHRPHSWWQGSSCPCTGWFRAWLKNRDVRMRRWFVWLQWLPSLESDGRCHGCHIDALFRGHCHSRSKTNWERTGRRLTQPKISHLYLTSLDKIHYVTKKWWKWSVPRPGVQKNHRRGGETGGGMQKVAVNARSPCVRGLEPIGPLFCSIAWWKPVLQLIRRAPETIQPSTLKWREPQCLKNSTSKGGIPKHQVPACGRQVSHARASVYLRLLQIDGSQKFGESFWCKSVKSSWTAKPPHM